MERTQIYLTDEQHRAIEAIAERREQTKSAIIREAIDRYIADSQVSRRRELMHQAAGIWADREDLPEFFEELRREWDRDILDEPAESLSDGQ